MSQTKLETVRNDASRKVSPTRKKKPTRAEKSRMIKEKLFLAAAKVVGELGYSNAMVSKITAAADVAQGTFYNHFESQQDLFDQLLPALGADLLSFVKDKSKDAPNAVEREKRSFKAFFEFLDLKPEFYRILYEAELFAPKAFQAHMNRIASSYVRGLEKDAATGEIDIDVTRGEAEVIAYSLMGVRHYLCMRFARANGQPVSLPEHIVDTYIKLVSEGVFKKGLPHQGG